jgi:alpha-galactosidase
MSKISFIGAGSVVFCKNVMGDSMLVPALQGFEFAIHDIDHEKLKGAEIMLNTLKATVGINVTIKAYTDRKECLRDAKFIINTIQVGGYDPIERDIEIPKKYGLRQTIADTIGVGGLFRSLRTVPALREFARDIEEVCPDAFFLNYTNPMSVLTNVLLDEGVKAVGLCHSVQKCIPRLFEWLDMDTTGVNWKIAGINHMAWLLEVNKNGQDLYPEIKRRAAEKQQTERHKDMSRFEIMLKFGYYVTESSNHTPEYYSYFMKKSYPELIERFNIPEDQVLKNLQNKVVKRAEMHKLLTESNKLEHTRSVEYASRIFEAVETNTPFKFAGNVKNTSLIANLPSDAVVEVACMVDGSGITPTHLGDLPPVLAGLNRTQINTQLLTLEAIRTGKKEHIYHAAMLDPHTGAELSLDDIVSMCDELIEAHQPYLTYLK